MTIYKCECCNYESHDKSNFTKHNSSKKHLEKVKQLIEISKPYLDDISNGSYVCSLCGIHFTKSCNLSRHKKTCVKQMSIVDDYENKINNLKKEIERLHNENIILTNDNRKEINHIKTIHKQELKSFEHQIESLQRENQRLLSLVNNAGSIMKSSISTTNYIIKNFKDAPALAAPKDFSKLTYANHNTEPDSDNENSFDENTESETEPIIDMRNAFVEGSNKDLIENEPLFDVSIKEKEKFVEKIAQYYRKRQINKYLGDIIIKHYKKKDPKDQSIFNSDTTRLTYIIRELFDNQTIDWTVDKKGIKTTNYIINPFLEHIKELIREYMQIKTTFDRETVSTKELEANFDNLTLCGQIIISIEKKELSDEILKYIAPYFYYMKENKENLLK